MVPLFCKVTTQVSSLDSQYLVSPVGISATVTLWRLLIAQLRQTDREFGQEPSCTEGPAEPDTCVEALQRLGPQVPRREQGRRGWQENWRIPPPPNPSYAADFLIVLPFPFCAPRSPPSPADPEATKCTSTISEPGPRSLSPLNESSLR